MHQGKLADRKCTNSMLTIVKYIDKQNIKMFTVLRVSCTYNRQNIEIHVNILKMEPEEIGHCKKRK